MRRIARLAPPAFLRSAPVLEARETLFSFLRRRPDARQQQRLPLDDDLFRSQGLMGPLIDQFHGKCAYCEAPVEHAGFVDHFRPLRFGGDRDSANGAAYYSWLAFEWRNMFLACGLCNKIKETRFPVFGPRAAFLAAFDDARMQEDPMLVDPTIDDPARHFHFSAHGEVHRRSSLGGACIDILQLNRPDLVEARRDAIALACEMITQRGAPSQVVPLTHKVPHSGAVAQVLARVAKGWRSGMNWPSIHTDRFFKRFFEDVAQAEGQARRTLLRQVEMVREAEDGLEAWYAPSSPDGATSPDGSWRDAQLEPLPPQAGREIRSIRISGFKAIDRVEFNLPNTRETRGGAPCLMILGENSTGKSTILAAIALALAGRKQAKRLVRHWPALVRSDRSDQWDQLSVRPVEVDIDFHFSKGTAALHFDPASDTLEGNLETSAIVLAYGPRRYFDRKRRDRGRGAARRIRTLFDPLATIPYPADWLAQLNGAQFFEVAKALRLVLALDDEDEFVSEPERGLCVRANGKVTPVEWLSDGYRAVFAMTVDIMRELLDHYSSLELAQAVVLIDEIETHLHPRWKMQVMRSLRRAFPRVQFIATTHDPLCLRGMDDGEIVVLQRTADERIVQLADLPSVQGMTAEQILTSDLFGLASTADPDVERVLGTIQSPAVSSEALPAGAQAMIERLVIGDNPVEEVLQSALKTFLKEREPAVGALRSDVRKDAIATVLSALKGDVGEPN